MEWFADVLRALESAIGWIFSPNWLPPKDFELFKWLIVPGFGYGIVLVLFALAELLIPAQRRSRGRRTLLSATYLILAGKLGVYALLITPLIRNGWVYAGLPSLHLDRTLSLWLYVPLAVLTTTFTGYWAHRLMHRVPLLWNIHKIHHSVENLNWSSVYHFHFLEFLLQTPFHLIVVLSLGTDLVAPFGIVFKLIDVMGHSNIGIDFGRLSYVISTPQAHRVHHSRKSEHYDTNFGNTFMIWDHVFGTFSYDPERPATEFGVKDDVPVSFFKQQVLPLVWIVRDLSRGVRRRFGRAGGGGPRR